MKRTENIRRCRLCASEDNFNSFSNIFDDNPELELEIKITKLLPVVVMPWDSMPHIVCHECIGKLNSFNDFYEASLKTEKLLRRLYPSVPENELENVDPIVHVLDSPSVNVSPLKSSKGVSRSPENVETPDDAEGGGGGTPKKTLKCFFVNSITTRDSVFTCRDCYRIFTKQSSALTHSCVGPEDCRKEVEEKNSGKSLPPLKIRLFSMKSGLFICSQCQEPFEAKTELVEHIKRHFLDGKWEKKAKRKCGKKKSRRRSRCQEEEEDCEESGSKTTRRKKKCTEIPKKRRKSKIAPLDDAYDTSRETREGSSSQREELGATETQQPSTTEEAPKEGKDSGDSSGVPSEREDGFDDDRSGMENPTECDDGKSDEVTVLEVINNKTPTNFSACIFCDKIFATKEALVAHQNRHLMGHPGFRSDARKDPDDVTLFCGSCGMAFSSRMSLEEHEGFHQVDAEWGQRSIRIALVSRGGEEECLARRGGDVIAITVSPAENEVELA